jgi:hypothetical protein
MRWRGSYCKLRSRRDGWVKKYLRHKISILVSVEYQRLEYQRSTIGWKTEGKDEKTSGRRRSGMVCVSARDGEGWRAKEISPIDTGPAELVPKSHENKCKVGYLGSIAEELTSARETFRDRPFLYNEARYTGVYCKLASVANSATVALPYAVISINLQISCVPTLLRLLRQWRKGSEKERRLSRELRGAGNRPPAKTIYFFFLSHLGFRFFLLAPSREMRGPDITKTLPLLFTSHRQS